MQAFDKMMPILVFSKRMAVVLGYAGIRTMST